MAQDLPSCDLTPESRVLNHLMKDWHRTTDHEFDLQLDFLYSEDSVPKEFQSNYCSNLYRNFDWSMPTSGKVPGMEQHANATDTAARAQASEAQAAENQQAAVHDAAATSPLAHPLNDFDNPEYHVQSSHTDASGSSAQVALGSSTEAKRETTASSGTNPVNPTVPSAPNHGAQIAGGHHPMQRTATEPNIHSSFLQSHGLPASSGSYYQASGIHPGLRSQYQQPPQSTATSYGRMRGHTAGYTPVSHHTQQYQQYPIPIESNLRHPMDSVWNHGVAPYPLTQVSNGVAYQLYDTVGQNDFTFNPQASSSNGIGINRNNNHENVLTSNSLRGNVNNSRLIGSHNHHIYNSGSLPMTNPEDHYFHPTESHAPPAYMNVPAAKILKSQPAVSSGGTVSSNLSAGSRSRNAATKIQQYLDMVNEDEELDLPEVELNYSTIEAAKAAERPKLKTNAHKDETIPRTDEEKQLMVKFLYRCMHTTKKGTGEGDAKDNQGMINQWLKLRQDEARVEQAAWRVLDLCLQMHMSGTPLVPNKTSCQRYHKFIDRWHAICIGLRTQKTMCKHLLGADFSAQLVNDPENATTRVVNNRKVNSAKKNYYEKGRQATTEPSGSRGHRASSLSPEDDGTFGPLMDEDAEGELDEEYQVLQDQPNNHYLTASQLGSTLPQASGLARSYKHEIQDEDSDYAVGRGKKSRRTTSGARRAPANGNTKKQRRPPGSRSNYQVVGEGLMIDVRDKKFERAVMEQGSPGVQAQFNAIHYPNGRPTDAGASRRSSRAAAPTTFRGVSNSDEVGNDESGSHYEGTEDEHHQAAHPHQS